MKIIHCKKNCPCRRISDFWL